MKICVPSLSPNDLESELSEHFGSAPFYIIYDTEKKAHEVVNNGDTEHQHGSCMPVDLLKREYFILSSPQALIISSACFCLPNCISNDH